MNLFFSLQTDHGLCIPRESGDEPSTIVRRMATGLYSPRERG